MPTTAAGLLARLRALERWRGYSLRDQTEEADAVEAAATAEGFTALALRASLVRADLLCARGDLAGSLAIVRHAAQEAEVLDDPELEARIHFMRYLLHHEAGDLPEARWHARRSVEVLPADAPRWLRAESLLAVTVVVDPAGGALDPVFAELLEIARDEHDAQVELFTLNNMAWTVSELGRPEEALELAARMRAVAAASGLPLRSPDLDTIATVELRAGRPDDALATITAALDPAVTGDVQPEHLVIALLTTALVLQALGRGDEALHHLELAHRTAVERRLPSMLAEVEEVRADHHAAHGEWEAAYRAHVRHHAAVEALREAQAVRRTLLAEVEHESRTTRRDRDHYLRLAHTDSLTGLANRRAAQALVEAELARRSDPDTSGSEPSEGGVGGVEVTVAIVDVDHFKSINDTFSHDAGDLVLQTLAGVLTAVCAEDPALSCARIGGEEFLLVRTGPLADAVAAAQALHRRIAATTWPGLPPGHRITVSTGAACTSEGPASFSELLTAADARLYAAKRGGRDRIEAGADAQHLTAGV